MKQKFLKILIFIVILSFYASFLVIKISLPQMDNDAGLYVSDGKVIWQTQKTFRQNIYSFTVPDYPIYDHHWLSSVIFYLTHEAFGFKGLTILKTLVLLSAFAVLFFAAMKKSDFWMVAALSLPTILMLSQRNRIRPEMFSYLFIALFLYLLFDLEKHPERKRIFWLIPLQLLWVNFHILFFVGIVLVAGFLFEKIALQLGNLVSKWTWKLSFQVFHALLNDPVIKKLLLILPMLVAVVFINPNGLQGALAPFDTHSYATFTVSENQPLFNFKASIFTYDIFSSAFVPMIVLFLLSFAFGFRQKPIFFFFAGVGVAGVGLIQVRLVTLFGMMFLPAVSANFNGAYFKIKSWLKRKWPKAALVLGYSLAIIVAAAFPYKAYRINANAMERGYPANLGVGLDRYSNNAAEFFKKQNIKGPIFNDYDIGGYIIYHLFPDEKVFVDNNGADSYPISFFDDIYSPAFSNEEKWIETQEKYKLNTIFISLRGGSPDVGGFLWRRIHDPEWALVYADTYSIIFVKNVAENREIIEKFHIRPENITKRIKHLLESKSVIDRIIGARLLYLSGEEDLATSLLKKIVAQYPRNSWAWMYAGAIKVYQNNPRSLVSAIIFLENAVNMGEKTSEGYTWLGFAYFRFGQFEKAERAFQRALWLEPGRLDTTNYLRQLQEYLKQ